jgi:ATP-dependent helicase/DNAse subunit B
MHVQASEGRLQDAEETAQLWDILCGVLDQFVELLGDQPLTVEDFSQLLRQILAEYSVGTIPVSLDQVTVSEITRNDRHTVKYLFLLGATDDVLPTVPASQGVLDRDDRKSLRQRDIHLSDETFDPLDNEMQNIYACLAQPTEKLCVSYPLTGLDGAELSEMVQLSHASTLNNVLQRRQKDPSLVPTSIATIPQIRMTRRIVGEYTLHDTQMHKFFPDSIGMVSDWRKRGPIYEVPFSTLYSSQVKNLITAGRCTSVTDSMWDIMRVIPCCAVTGEAAGVAAAMTDDFSTLDVAALQKILKAGGVVLHEQDLS